MHYISVSGVSIALHFINLWINGACLPLHYDFNYWLFIIYYESSLINLFFMRRGQHYIPLERAEQIKLGD